MIYLIIILCMLVIYSFLWLDMAYKIKNTLIEFASVKKTDLLNVNFDFSSYKIKNFPFDIEIYFIKPHISIVLSNDTKNKLMVATETVKAKYPLFSRKILLSFHNLEIKDQKNNTNISNIKEPVVLEIPLFKNDKKKYRIQYTDNNLTINSSNSADYDADTVDSIIDFTIENLGEIKDINSFIRLSNNTNKLPFMEYDLNVKIESSTVFNAKFDVKKIFTSGTDDWIININGKFDLTMGSIPEIEYNGNLNAYFKNYKNMFSYFNSISPDAELIMKILADAGHIDGNDLHMQITTKEDTIYFGKLSAEQIIESYSKYFSNHIYASSITQK